MFSLEGKTAVITGGGRGIGRGISRAMAQVGANIVITGRNPDVLEDTAEEMRGIGAETLVLPGDITKMDTIDEIIRKTLDKFGYIDCWVNNAGSANAEDVGEMIDITEENWDNVVDLNLKWAFFCAQAAARTMSRGGSIINITSRSGIEPGPMTGQYGAAKAGLNSLTATLAVEWGHMGIRVNAIAPGVVLVERSSGMKNTNRQRRQIETVPLRRLGEVDDIGPLAVYFASDEAQWISGQVIQANGGSRISVGLLTYLWRKNKMMEEKEGVEIVD